MSMAAGFDRRHSRGMILICVLVSLAARPDWHPAGLPLLGLGAADARGRGGERRAGLSCLPDDKALDQVQATLDGQPIATDQMAGVPHACQNRRETAVASGHPRVVRTISDLGTRRSAPITKRPSKLSWTSSTRR